jgi:hypothetical protein
MPISFENNSIVLRHPRLKRCENSTITDNELKIIQNTYNICHSNYNTYYHMFYITLFGVKGKIEMFRPEGVTIDFDKNHFDDKYYKNINKLYIGSDISDIVKFESNLVRIDINSENKKLIDNIKNHYYIFYPDIVFSNEDFIICYRSTYNKMKLLYKN